MRTPRNTTTCYAVASTHRLNNPAHLVSSDRQISIIYTPVHEPGPGEVTLQIKSSGIGGWDDSLEVRGDCILCPEAAAVELKCWEGVTDLASVPCNNCFLCRQGRLNLCEDVKFSGIRPDEETIQRYKVPSSEWLYKIPYHLTYSQGALLEPLSVILHGIDGAKIRLGRPALIFSAGPIGLISLVTARANSLSRRLSQVANHLRPMQDSAASRAQNISGTCSEPQNMRLLHRSLNVIGAGRQAMNSMSFVYLSLAELDTWPVAIRCLGGGILDPERLVTHRFPVDRAVTRRVKVHIADKVDAVF
ncbi:GroES-like protein [Xylariaceae sp. FL0016]|nr:GroES-like protein [Xylariaceae sp. FL0016]